MISPEFIALKKQVEAMSSGQEVPTPSQRKAAFWQMHLRDTGMAQEFSLLLSELNPNRSSELVGPHGHTYETYQLEWKHMGKKTFALMVTNIKAKKSLPLVKCPEYLIEIILPQMEIFIQKMITYLSDNATYDEDYASNGEDELKSQIDGF